MIAQRANDPVESTRRIFAAFTNPSLGREQVEPLLAEIDQLRRTRDDLVEANNRYQQEARDARAEVRSLSESKREMVGFIRLFLFNYAGMEDGDGNEAPELAVARAVIAKEAGHAE